MSCAALKSDYARAVFSYNVASSHVRFAAEALKKRGSAQECKAADGARLLKALWPAVQSPLALSIP
jgi:hypothetical protein